MVEGVVILSALLIAVLVLVWAVKVIKETLITGLLVVLILILLFVAFRITPAEVYEALLQVPPLLRDMIGSPPASEP